MRKCVFLIVLLVIIQVHLLSFTVNVIFNPVTIIYLFYYGSPLHGENYDIIPILYTFAIHCIITFLIVNKIMHKTNYYNCIASFVVGLVVLIVGYYLFETRFSEFTEKIDHTRIATFYYEIYNYRQAFRSILGYSIIQLILLGVYYSIYILRIHNSSSPSRVHK